MISPARPSHRRRGIEVKVVAYLLIQRPGRDDERFSLPEGQLRVGRLSDNELVIDDQSISRHHALIASSGEGHTIEDLGSRNGVWLNGQRSGDTPVPLREGDEVELGGQGVMLQYFGQEASAPDATAFFTQVPRLETWRMPDVREEGERWMKILRVTPWLRFVAAALGALAAFMALAWWIGRFLTG